EPHPADARGAPRAWARAPGALPRRPPSPVEPGHAGGPGRRGARPRGAGGRAARPGGARRLAARERPHGGRAVSDVVARDRAVAWHPYTQPGLEDDPLPVRSASGARLVLDDGRSVIDAISSWWACLHGHGDPRLVRAIAEQAATLDHVLFAGATHEPAVRLAERLLEVAPPSLARVFFSDDGS